MLPGHCRIARRRLAGRTLISDRDDAGALLAEVPVAGAGQIDGVPQDPDVTAETPLPGLAQAAQQPDQGLVDRDGLTQAEDPQQPPEKRSHTVHRGPRGPGAPWSLHPYPVGS